MLRIGLTGGIGSGKTTVADAFANHGVPVIDADIIAHELVEPGLPALESIVKAFGDNILDKKGHLKRNKLRELILVDEGKRRKLESILHPAIHNEIETRINQIHAAYCILVIPLLIETRLTDMVDKVLVVDVSKNTQIERVKNRGKLSEDEIQSIIGIQCSREERLKAANEIVTNEGTLEDLAIQIAHLHQKFQQFAST
ncbi:MAG: dephospho-CoA kinase [Gammaproteobacteria bacterium]|nr:dephospho-CoA kinase [Gammaproteobacteria bacterium]